jgi:hypothetical protein
MRDATASRRSEEEESKMTSGADNTAESTAKAVVEVLATTYERTKEIYWILKKHPAVTGITHDCLTLRSRDFATGQEDCCFEAYVDATTRTNGSFCWRVDVVSKSSGWELDRTISTPIGQRDVDERFEEVSFARFSELAAGYSTLMDEFVESARTFDFDNPYGRVSGSKSS